jgi:hypothetical protein
MNISPPETTEPNAYSNATNATNAIRGSCDVQMQRNHFGGSPVEESLPPRMHMEDMSIHKLERSPPSMGIGMANMGAINKKKGEIEGKLSSSSSSGTGTGIESKLAEIQKASSAHLQLQSKSKGVASKLAEIQKASAQEAIKAKETAAAAVPSTPIEGEKKKRKRKSWKKPKDKPKRPLSAYNLFFQAERATMLGNAAAVADNEKKKPNKKRVHRKSHGKIGFAEMARIIGGRWKAARDEDKKQFEARADIERKRYEVELETWKETQRLKTLELELETQQRQGSEAAAAVAHQSSLLAAMQQQQQHQQMPQQGGMGSLGMSSHGNFPADSGSYNEYSMRMTETERLLQQRQQQVGGEYLRQPQGLSPSIDYLRALQERRQLDRAGLLNHPPGMMDTLTHNTHSQSSGTYPNAAAASATAIMQMQQQQLQQQQVQQQQLQAQLRQLNAASSRMGGGGPMGATTNVSQNQSQDDFELHYLTMLRQRQQQQQQQGQQLSDMNEYSGGMNNYGGGNQGNMNLYGDRRHF